MPLRAAVAAVVLLAAPMAATQEPPIATSEKPLSEIAEQKAPEWCDTVAQHLDKWAQLLQMKDWKIQVYCVEIPPWEDQKDMADLRGSSVTVAETKTIHIWVDKDDRDLEAVCVHELMHGLINYAVKARSKTVEENMVVILSGLLEAYNDALMAHKKGEKKLRIALDMELSN